jgi:ribosomal protein L39E
MIFLIIYFLIKYYFINIFVNIKEFLYKYIIEKKEILKMEETIIKKTKAQIAKEYRQNNPSYVCERCGGKVHYGQKSAHERSKKHLWAIENNFYFKKSDL